MKRLHLFSILWGFLLWLASTPLWLTLPLPDPALRVDKAHDIRDGEILPLTLPASRQPPGSWRHYRVSFTPDDTLNQYLFIPVLSQRALVSLNGTPIDDTENRTTMIGLASGISAMVPLPPTLLSRGENQLDIHVQSISFLPGYLSALYIGTSEQLGMHYRLRVFLLEYLKLMVAAGHLMMTLVVLTIWIYRPQDALFGWLSLLLALSMVSYFGTLRDVIPKLVAWMPYFMIILSAAAVALLISILLIIGRDPPRWLQWSSLVIPAVCLLLVILPWVPARALVLMVNVPLNILGVGAGFLLAALAARRPQQAEARLLVFPLLMASLAALHDFAVVMTWLDGPVCLSVYYRPLLLIGFGMILMRRLAVSLTRLDDANITLTERLHEQERQLERLHREEQREAARRIRSEERQRLTRDLHDGLSGHLASIIALSEKEGSGQVERSAREALDDLRLVIHSLDINDRELPLALAGLRERMERQLKRLGIRLEWSMTRLPEISGVTPSRALSVLRILQEATTNAIHHGNPAVIRIHGLVTDSGLACIRVENDGKPFVAPEPVVGHGLKNMIRRAQQLGGSLQIAALPSGTCLTLILPLQLPTDDEHIRL